MTRQKTIEILSEMIIAAKELKSDKDYIKALENAMRVLSEIQDDYFEYLTIEIPND